MLFSYPGRTVLAGAAVLSLCLATPSFGQAPEPDSSSLSFQDWTVNCASAKPKGPEKTGEKPLPPVCEMIQSYVDKDSQRLVGRVELGRPQPGAEFKLVIQAPIGVSIPEGATLTLPNKATVKAPYLKCAPSVCIAETDVKKDFIDAAKAADKMTLTFADGARLVSLNVSTRGFVAALATLEKR